MIRKKIIIIIFLSCCTGLLSFFTRQRPGPKEKIKAYYTETFSALLQQIAHLKKAVADNKDGSILRNDFLQARLVYKQLEPLLEYYFAGDVKYFNGLAVPYIEEEDPAAYQQPQGFQVIEAFLFPAYETGKKKELMGYISQLEIVAKGLAGNQQLFNPQEYMPDAVMEELYRILALGISGFDSPIAKYSLPEASAAMGSLQRMMEIYAQDWQPLQPVQYRQARQLLNGAMAYLNKHRDFDRFNRMEFILSFLNPLCDALGHIKASAGYKEDPLHYSLLKRKGSLFLESSLNKNRYGYNDTANALRQALGKKLFYEPLLSVNNKRSCAGCHQASLAFTDGLPKALQLDGHSTLPRNTPTLWNASLQMNLFYDSRKVLLQDVVMEVLGNEKEMNSGAAAAIQQLSVSGHYQQLFRQAYGAAGTVITEKNVANAIAAYISTLISYRSSFDQYMRGQKDKLKPAEINGFNLFMGKAKCGTCHYIPLFNGSKPPTYYYQESEVLGVPANTDTLHPVLDNDPGRISFLKIDFMQGAFKTPTLRNIALTAPYMHNGVYKTLEEVIDFYDRGGGQGMGLGIPNQTLPADRLQLTPVEKKELKAFLLTLTDTSAVK